MLDAIHGDVTPFHLKKHAVISNCNYNYFVILER